jgi:hypothetical protein
MKLHEIRRKVVAALGVLAVTASAIGVTTIATQTAASAVAGTVSGIVYRDWNYNGTTTDRFSSTFVTPADFTDNREWPESYWSGWTLPVADTPKSLRYARGVEPVEPGINITVTDRLGATWTGTSGANGTFSISVVAADTAAVRVEMSIPASKSFLVPGPKGLKSFGNVQFVTLSTASAVNMHFSVANPAEYCKHDSSAVLRLITPCWKFGDQKWPIPTSGPAPLSVLNSLPFDTPHSTYTSPPGVISEATSNQIGTTFGLAWDPYRANLFAASYMRRHAGFGPNGTGAIYKVSGPGTGSKVVSVYADLNALFGAGTAGVDPHPTTGTNCSGAQVYNPAVHAAPITTCEAAWGHDVSSYDKVGKISLGDMDISEDGTYLYVVNMADKKIYRMSASTPPAAAADVTRVDIPLAASGTAGLYKCAAADSRPMALTIHDGVGYVGVTCSQESGSGASDSRAYVYQFDPVAMTFTAAPALQFKWDQAWYNYRNGAAGFTAWTSTWVDRTTGPLGDGTHNHSAQPIISTIAFDDQDMLVGVRNRFHDQIGEATFDLTGTETTRTSPSSYDGGSIVRSCPSAGKWAAEGDAAGSPAFAEANCTGGYRHWTTIGTEAVTTYSSNSLYSFNTQNTEGPMVLLQGSQSRRADLYTDGTRHTDLNGGKLVYTAGDPNGSSWAAGIATINPNLGYNTTNGATNATTGYASGSTDGSNFAIYNGAGYSDFVVPPADMGKSNGLGDLEVLCLFAPIDIGDRVWQDSNNDGLQQADEPGLANITVQLMAGSSPLVTIETDTNGNYLFSSRAGTTTANAAYAVTGLNAGSTTAWSVKVDTADPQLCAGCHLATRNAGTNGRVDSDGLPTGMTSSFLFTTSYSQSFDFDFGFCTTVACNAGVLYAIGDTVFNDTNANGTKDTGEIGTSGITVELLNSSSLAVLAGPITTSSSGGYKFDNLVAGTYKIRFSSLPSGSTWTTQTVGSDQAIDSNPDATTGITATITLATSGNPNQRAAVSGDGVTATQIDPSIDAGVRPPTSSVSSTVCLVPT